MVATVTYEELITQNEELKSQLEEAHNIIDAIRAGEVDAFIVNNNNAHQIYTLKTADQTYRIFIEKMAEGAITINKEGIVLYCNSSFAKMINLPLENVLGSAFINFIPQHNRQSITAIINSAWHKERQIEITLPGKEKEIPVLLSLNTMEIDGGLALSIIVANLSFQKEVQEQLKQKNQELLKAQQVTKTLNFQLQETVRERTNELFKSRENFKFLADNIPAIVWTTNGNGVLDYYNKRWFEYTGSKNLDGNEFSSFLHPEDLKQYHTAWNNTIQYCTDFEIVHRLKRAADEKYRWHFSQAIPYKNNKNEVVAWFGISTDIDDQKVALEKKDEFISIASHELKTPVTSIKGYVQILQFNFSQEGNTHAAGLLSKVDLQINKLTQLISDLLDVTKIENGQLQYHIDNFDFNTLVYEIAEETGRVLKKHVVNTMLAPSKNINGDRNKIGQVITNFIENAGKYSPAGAQIIINTVINKNSLRLNVQDFGIGIPEEQQCKIFERFFRVSAEKENTYAGLGLGLYISAEIIKRHNGVIGVDSKKGEGSVFYFELPFV